MFRGGIVSSIASSPPWRSRNSGSRLEQKFPDFRSVLAKFHRGIHAFDVGLRGAAARREETAAFFTEFLPGPFDGRMDGGKLLERSLRIGKGVLPPLLDFETSFQCDGSLLPPAQNLHLGEDPFHDISTRNATVAGTCDVRPVRAVVRPLRGRRRRVFLFENVRGVVRNVRVGTLVSEVTSAVRAIHGALKEPADEAVGVKPVITRQHLLSSVRPCLPIGFLADSARRVGLCHFEIVHKAIGFRNVRLEPGAEERFDEVFTGRDRIFKKKLFFFLGLISNACHINTKNNPEIMPTIFWSQMRDLYESSELNVKPITPYMVHQMIRNPGSLFD